MCIGVPFSDSSQPQFCAELKTQIDQLMLSHDVGVGLGRTVGSALDIAKHLRQHTKGLLVAMTAPALMRFKWVHAHSSKYWLSSASVSKFG